MCELGKYALIGQAFHEVQLPLLPTHFAHVFGIGVTPLAPSHVNFDGERNAMF